MAEEHKPRVPMVPGPNAHTQVTARQSVIEVPTAAAPRRSATGNIAKAVAGVMREAGTIEKRGLNRFHNYHYARMEDILHAITPLMGKTGLAIVQSEIERNIVETRLAVTYEFTVLHESGESLPPSRGTGMAIARDSKGNWDDKAINKCHTAARKYFLLSLFQLPAGDFDDADADRGTDTKPEDRRVPGPAESGPQDDAVPTRIPMKGNADEWSRQYLQAIGRARTLAEVAAWDKANDDVLQRLSDNHRPIYDRLRVAVERRIEDLSRPTPAPENLLPDPRLDAQAAINWVAQQLNDFHSYEAAESFWNQLVAPRERDFAPTDFDLLVAEWRSTEARLSPALE